MLSDPSMPSFLPRIGGLNSGPGLYLDSCESACARSSGVKSMMSSGMLTKFLAYAGGFVGKGCVGEYVSPGTSPRGTGRSSMGHTGSP